MKQPLETAVQLCKTGVAYSLVILLTGRWTVLIDVGRQGLFAIQSESEDINHFFTAFREIAISLCRFASKQPDLLANSTRGEAAVLLGLVAMVTVLMSPDFEQLTQSITTLRAMKTLTLIAHKVYLPGSSPQGTNFNSPQLRIAMRCRFFDEISRMPPTAGKAVIISARSLY